MIRWVADTLHPIGAYMACLLRSILSAWDGLGPHLGGLGNILGMAWLLRCLETQNGLDCIQAEGLTPVKVGGDLSLLDFTINPTTV